MTMTMTTDCELCKAHDIHSHAVGTIFLHQALGNTECRKVEVCVECLAQGAQSDRRPGCSGCVMPSAETIEDFVREGFRKIIEEIAFREGIDHDEIDLEETDAILNDALFHAATQFAIRNYDPDLWVSESRDGPVLSHYAIGEVAEEFGTEKLEKLGFKI